MVEVTVGRLGGWDGFAMKRWPSAMIGRGKLGGWEDGVGKGNGVGFGG